jgi:deoxyribodipyrimidine photolyase-like uncharacterized protein
VLVLGDQLDMSSTAFDGFDKQAGVAWMTEVLEFYWTAETEMQCHRHCIRQTLDYGYAYQIPSLMEPCVA